MQHDCWSPRHLQRFFTRDQRSTAFSGKSILARLVPELTVLVQSIFSTTTWKSYRESPVAYKPGIGSLHQEVNFTWLVSTVRDYDIG